MTKKKMAKVGAPEIPTSFQSPESSSVVGATYDHTSGHMTVFFVRGPVYDFDHIPLATWASFAMSTSKGSYFNHMIRPLYSGVKRVA